MTSPFAQGVSVIVGVICLVAAALMWFPGGKQAPRVAVVLLMTGIAGILGSPIGQWLRNAVVWANDGLTSIIGRFTGTAILGIVAAIALYFVVMDLWKKGVEKKTLLAAALLPILITTIPGPVGDVAHTAITATTGLVGMGVGALFGMS